MKNQYVIVSSDKITIDTQVKDIFSKFEDIEKIHYDLTEVPIERVIEDLDTYNFLSKRKGIVCTQVPFLSKEKEKSEVEHNLQTLEKYLLNPNPDNVLILVTDHLDKRKKIVSLLSENATVIEKDISLNDLLKKEFKDYKIDSRTLNFLIDYCGGNNERVLQEVEKLKIYRWEEKEITSTDIREIVIKDSEDSVFSLVDSLLKGNKKESFDMYQDLLLHGEQVPSILSKLANKIRLIYQVKVLLKEGLSDQEIGRRLGSHPYPVKLARENSYNYSDSMLLEYLSKLAQVDFEMKSGNVVAGVAFEVFMASL